MWNIHENRIKQGLKPSTVESSGLYWHHNRDYNYQINTGFSVRHDQLTQGTV